MRKLLETLYTMYYQDIYRYLYSLSRDAALSEDLASEVFLEAVKSIAAFREASDIKTWLFSIARHRWFRYLRKKKPTVSLEELPTDLASPEKPPEQQCLDRALLRRTLELLESEPERTRRIVRMRLEGDSFREIGNALGISENSARVIDFRAKNRLRRILREEGYEDA